MVYALPRVSVASTRQTIPWREVIHAPSCGGNFSTHYLSLKDARHFVPLEFYLLSLAKRIETFSKNFPLAFAPGMARETPTLAPD
jgi:hypothetical protein